MALETAIEQRYSSGFHMADWAQTLHVRGRRSASHDPAAHPLDLSVVRAQNLLVDIRRHDRMRSCDKLLPAQRTSSQSSDGYLKINGASFRALPNQCLMLGFQEERKGKESILTNRRVEKTRDCVPPVA